MSIIATVISPGPQTTVQDAGRTGIRHLGVPQSGAADRVSFALANGVLGNHWAAPALECALGGLSLEFMKPCAFALGGADMRATLNNLPVSVYSKYAISAGDKLVLGQAALGIRSYVAIEGGVAGAEFLNSVATHLPAKLGGIDGRALQAGDAIAAQGAPGTPIEIPNYLFPIFGKDWFLRATAGPEFDTFDNDAKRRFFSTPFTADARGDRMGMRLISDPLNTPQSPPMKSSAVFPGTVQCPPDGAPFLLLADAQTLGGYPRIAQIIDADLHLTGQIRPGDRIWFNETSPEAARMISQQRASYYAAALKGFRLT